MGASVAKYADTVQCSTVQFMLCGARQLDLYGDCSGIFLHYRVE